MVVRRRFRAVLVPLLLYGISGAVVGYFVHHAHSGNRGLAAKRALKIQAHELNKELEGVKAEHAGWDRRIALLRSDQVDRDLLEERARIMLGRVHRNDLVIITP
jgi:cell division protein FtsB